MLSAVHFKGQTDRPNAVFLHGLSRGALSVEPLLPAFGDTWALDHIGHGASDRAPRYRVIDYAPPLIDWIAQNIQSPVVLYGHSLGSMLAPLIAAALPDRVKRIVMEDPPFTTMSTRLRETDWFPYFQSVAPLAGQWLSPDELGQIGYQGLDGRPVQYKDTRTPEMLARMAQFLGMLDPKVFDEVLTGHWLDGYTWPGLQHPTLILQADPSHGGMLRDEDIPSGAQVERLAGIGHLAHWQAPERIHAILRSWQR
jgi:pimeloyl-ACP methyl ester carboxylesterase